MAKMILLRTLVVLTLLPSLPAAEKPKHILLIMADDLGIEAITCYGGESYQTPNLDRLAATGLRFTHAYSQPLCTPTRLEIMTGRENHRNWLYFGILPPEETTFGHLMQSFGYKTCIAGKWQLQSYDPPGFPGGEERRGTGMHPKDAGFDCYSLFHALHTEDKGSRYGNPTFLENGKLHREVDGKYGEDISVEFILKFLEDNKSAPTFVYYPMALPHWPVNPTPHSEDWKDQAKRLNEDQAYFPDMVAYMDTLVGRLIDGLDKIGIREETLVLFYSDNGTDRKVTSQFRGQKIQGGKNTTAQTGIRVPLIANWPGIIKPATNSNLIDASDFFPTLADLAGKEVPTDLQLDGFSFAPQLHGEEGTPRDWAFFWYDPRPGWDKEQFTRSIFALDQDYKLFSDGRIYSISGDGLRETPLDPEKLNEEAKAAKAKLSEVITTIMQPPLSPSAQLEVDAHGNLVE